MKFGDKQRSFGLLDPFGALFGMVADFHNINISDVTYFHIAESIAEFIREKFKFIEFNFVCDCFSTS